MKPKFLLWYRVRPGSTGTPTHSLVTVDTLFDTINSMRARVGSNNVHWIKLEPQQPQDASHWLCRHVLKKSAYDWDAVKDEVLAWMRAFESQAPKATEKSFELRFKPYPHELSPGSAGRRYDTVFVGADTLMRAVHTIKELYDEPAWLVLKHKRSNETWVVPTSDRITYDWSKDLAKIQEWMKRTEQFYAAPKTSMAEANRKTIEGLREKLNNAPYIISWLVSPKTGKKHLLWMCDELIAKEREFPADKSGRWIGYIQGVMAAYGLLDVDEERARTREWYAPPKMETVKGPIVRDDVIHPGDELERHCQAKVEPRAANGMRSTCGEHAAYAIHQVMDGYGFRVPVCQKHAREAVANHLDVKQLPPLRHSTGEKQAPAPEYRRITEGAQSPIDTNDHVVMAKAVENWMLMHGLTQLGGLKL